MRRLILLLSILAGCAASTVSVAPIEAYRTYGDFQPERDQAVLAKAPTADGSKVVFLQESPPEGVEITAENATVKPGYAHQLIGKFAYGVDELVSKTVLVERAKRVAAAAGGDTAVGIFIATDASDYSKAMGVEAVILKIDPRFKDPSQAAPAPEASGVFAVFPLQISLPKRPSDADIASLYELYTAKLSEAGLRIIPPDEVRSRLSGTKAESYRSCYDDTCQIQLGKELAASAVVQTTIALLGDECVVSAKLFDLKTETTLPGSSRRTSCAPKQLGDALESIAQQLAPKKRP